MSVKDEMKKSTGEIRKLTKQEWLALLRNEVDPLWHAGEGISDTEEIPRAADIANPYLRERIGREGEYHPGPYRRKKQ